MVAWLLAIAAVLVASVVLAAKVAFCFVFPTLKTEL